MSKERDTANAYRKQANDGDPKAMNNLGVCYMRGHGVNEDHEMAFQWSLRAASADDLYCCFNVAECYYRGDGV